MTTMKPYEAERTCFKVKDPYSALTHAIGFVFAIIGMPALLIRASLYGADFGQMVSYAGFMLSMILLYGASTSYHSFDVNDHVNRILKKIDHMSISVLIAGSYMPICMTAMKERGGSLLATVILALAAIGILFKLFWVTCPRWVSSLLYVIMGWACVIRLPALVAAMPKSGFLLLLAGGIFYTVGALIYAVKKPLTPWRAFGNHEVFHCFVLAGSLCHYLMAYHVLVFM